MPTCKGAVLERCCKVPIFLFWHKHKGTQHAQEETCTVSAAADQPPPPGRLGGLLREQRAAAPCKGCRQALPPGSDPRRLSWPVVRHRGRPADHSGAAV